MAEKQKRLYRVIAALLIICIAVAIISGCSSKKETGAEQVQSKTSGHEGDTIKIGVLLPMSGAQAKAGVEVKQAMNMFADIINESRDDIDIPLAASSGITGIDGKKIELVYGDLKTADTALSEAERLITSEDVVAICGLFSSATTKTAAVSTEKYGVPLFSEGTSPTLTQKGYQYFFRVFPDDTMYVEDTFQYLVELNEERNAGIVSVALVSEDTEFGKNIADLELEAASRYGFEVVENITYSSNATNLISEALKLKKSEPDVVLMSSYISDVILYMRTFKQLNYMPKMIIGQRGGFMTSELFTALGDDAEGLFSTSAWALDLQLPLVQQLNELYMTQYSGGVELMPDVLKSAVDLYILCIAMNQAGSADADAIKTAIENLEYPAEAMFIPGNGFEFNTYGQNTGGTSLISQIQEGAYRTVYPSEFCAVKGIFPVKDWDERNKE